MKIIESFKGGKIVECEFAPSGRAIFPDSLFSYGVRVRNFWELLRGKQGATLYSDAFTLVRNGRRVAPNIFGGRVRVLFWDFASLPAGNVGDVLVCGKIYDGERVLEGIEAHSALSSGAGTATGSYGSYAIASDGITLGAVDDVDRFLVATSMEAAGANQLAGTIAHFMGYEAASDQFVCCVNSGEAFATAGRVTGHLLTVR